MRSMLHRHRRWGLLPLMAAATLALALIGSTGLSQAEPAETELVINEVELNPDGRDGQRGVEEWVELFNPSDRNVDVNNYRLQTQAGYETLEEPIATFVATRDGQTVESAVVPADGYLVLHLDQQQWLDNRNEAVWLLNDGDEPLDKTPELTDIEDDDRTWQRIPDGQDTNTEIDWRFRNSSRGSANN